MRSRSLRRHHMERLKARMRRMMNDCWPRGRELAREIDLAGRLAQNHGTHDCIMCHFEKLYPKPRDRRIEEE
jgi:hypothetical protein